jgi:hypothetical protein
MIGYEDIKDLTRTRITQSMAGSGSKRRRRGTTIAELPLGLWMVFVGIGFPVFILATLTARFALFWEAAREAAQAACQARTFYNNPPFPSTALSAVNAANSAASNVLATFPGSTLTQPAQVWIVITPISSQGTLTPNMYGPNMALSAVNTDLNMYQVRVVLTGKVQPLFTLPFSYFGNIPGLTQAFPTTVAEERVFENPEGLIY